MHRLAHLVLFAAAAAAQDGESKTAATLFDPGTTVQRCAEVLLEMQEGDDRDEWPYEGVYRVRGEIPLGYRVGGTAIAALALLEAPGWSEHPDRAAAVDKAVAAILRLLEHPLMARGFEGTYDVRGWGYTYALLFLLRLDELGRTPSARSEAVAAAIQRLVGDVQDTAIASGGGWSYSRPSGFRDTKNAASPFMTGPTLQALFHAAARGHEVAAEVVTAALDSLERARTASGGYAYASRQPMAAKDEDTLGMMDKKPGSIGRMCVVEYTLQCAGRGSLDHLRDAIESFFTHWDELAKRKQKQGTHVRPYGVAPYYFMFAHYYVARAIEKLPDAAERDNARARLAAILSANQEPDGGFNDRVFPRSRNYGTAFGMMALMMRDIPHIPDWTAAASGR